MPAYAHEVEEAREEGVDFQLARRSPSRFVGDDRLEASNAARCSSASRTRAAAAGPSRVPGSEFVLPADTAVEAIGQQPRARASSAGSTALELDRGRIRSSTRDGPDRQPEVLRRRRRGQRRRDRRRGRPRREDRGARRSTRWLGGGAVIEIRWHARAGQGAKTASQLFAQAALRSRQERRRRSRSTGRSAAARRCAHTRASTTGRSGATTRSRVPTRSSCSSRRCWARPTSSRAGAGRRSARRTPTSRTGSTATRVVAGPGGRIAAGSGHEVRQPRHGRRTRRRARRAAARARRRTPRPSCSAEGRRGRVRAAVAGGVRVAELRPGSELPAGGVVVRDDAPRPRTGGWRTGVKPQRRPRRLRQLPALLALLPGRGRLVDGDDVRGLRLRLLQGLRDLRRDLPGERDRDGAGGRCRLRPLAARSC